MRVTIEGPNGSPHQQIKIKIGDVELELCEDRHDHGLIVRRTFDETPGMTLQITPVAGNVVKITGGR